MLRVFARWHCKLINQIILWVVGCSSTLARAEVQLVKMHCGKVHLEKDWLNSRKWSRAVE